MLYIYYEYTNIDLLGVCPGSRPGKIFILLSRVKLFKEI